MKRILAIILAAMMLLPLAACGGKTNTNSNNEKGEEEKKEPVYKIGETVSIDDFELTLKSVDFLGKITNGKEVNKSAVARTLSELDYYKDKMGTFVEEVTPKNDYTIMKFVISVGYNGKKEEMINLADCLTVDYNDGYTFEPLQIKTPNSDSPIDEEYMNGEQDSSGLTYYTTYLFNTDEDIIIDISNPLSFSTATRTVYIFVNKIIESDTEAPLYLLFKTPSSNQIKFDLRSSK